VRNAGPSTTRLAWHGVGQWQGTMGWIGLLCTKDIQHGVGCDQEIKKGQVGCERGGTGRVLFFFKTYHFF
jgi:hypothetical protein